MLGDFTYCNPTRVHFGRHALDNLADELGKYGPNVTLVYGGGSIRQNGIYDQVTAILAAAGKNVSEISGVMPNPTRAKMDRGIQIAREAGTDLLLAVGGGSAIDYAKAVAVGVHLDRECDPWQRYFVDFAEPTCDIVPVGCVLTMVGTGSEMNAGSVITDTQAHAKIGHVFKSPDVMPRFAILNPEFTFSVPHYQMVAGVYDIFSHICEQYFSGTDDNTTDYLAEGLMRSVVAASRAAHANPTDYEARSNIMWSATWALNTLLKCGKTTDWMVHMIGQAVGAHTDATHGMTLAAVSGAYYRLIMDAGLPKFARFAKAVWGINGEGKSEAELASAGLDAMQSWMKEIGLVLQLRDLGVTPDMIEAIADSTVMLPGGYKTLTRADVIAVLKESL